MAAQTDVKQTSAQQVLKIDSENVCDQNGNVLMALKDCPVNAQNMYVLPNGSLLSANTNFKNSCFTLGSDSRISMGRVLK